MLIPLLDLSRIQCRNDIATKSRLFEILASLLGSGLDGDRSRQILNALLEREAEGNTGLGHGIGLPHARLAGLDQMVGAFVQLASPIEYASPDDEPVDLILALLVPQEAARQHLQLLAELAARFSRPDFRDSLRQCQSPSQILDMFHELSCNA